MNNNVYASAIFYEWDTCISIILIVFYQYDIYFAYMNIS